MYSKKAFKNILQSNLLKTYFFSLIDEEITTNALKTIIPRLSQEWEVRVKFIMTGLSTAKWCTILQLTKGGQFEEYGDRTPGLFYNKETEKLTIDSAVNGNKLYRADFTIELNTEYNVEIHQRYKSGGVYKYSFLLNTDKKFTQWITHKLNNFMMLKFILETLDS